MFSTNDINEKVLIHSDENDISTSKPESTHSIDKYKNIMNICPSSTDTTEMNYSTIEQLLENEKQHNKTEQWSKLDKTIKIQKLNDFAVTYGTANNLTPLYISTLKSFFIDCLEKNKLNKTKDVQYDKTKREIVSIPVLHFNQSTRKFTLKIIDPKRVSTLKSLTPKHNISINK